MPRPGLCLLATIVAAATASTARADTVCPDSSYCTVSFGCT